MKELEKVLIGKFKLSAGFVKDMLDSVEDVAEIVQVTTHIKVILQPDEDNRVLECAVDGNAEFIVTGDTKHIFPLPSPLP